jgi:hypothetical protein
MLDAIMTAVGPAFAGNHELENPHSPGRPDVYLEGQVFF